MWAIAGLFPPVHPGTLTLDLCEQRLRRVLTALRKLLNARQERIADRGADLSFDQIKGIKGVGGNYLTHEAIVLRRVRGQRARAGDAVLEFPRVFAPVVAERPDPSLGLSSVPIRSGPLSTTPPARAGASPLPALEDAQSGPSVGSEVAGGSPVLRGEQRAGSNFGFEELGEVLRSWARTAREGARSGEVWWSPKTFAGQTQRPALRDSELQSDYSSERDDGAIKSVGSSRGGSGEDATNNIRPAIHTPPSLSVSSEDGVEKKYDEWPVPCKEKGVSPSSARPEGGTAGEIIESISTGTGGNCWQVMFTSVVPKGDVPTDSLPPHMLPQGSAAPLRATGQAPLQAVEPRSSPHPPSTVPPLAILDGTVDGSVVTGPPSTKIFPENAVMQPVGGQPQGVSDLHLGVLSSGAPVARGTSTTSPTSLALVGGKEKLPIKLKESDEGVLTKGDEEDRDSIRKQFSNRQQEFLQSLQTAQSASGSSRVKFRPPTIQCAADGKMFVVPGSVTSSPRSAPSAALAADDAEEPRMPNSVPSKEGGSVDGGAQGEPVLGQQTPRPRPEDSTLRSEDSLAPEETSELPVAVPLVQNSSAAETQSVSAVGRDIGSGEEPSAGELGGHDLRGTVDLPPGEKASTRPDDPRRAPLAALAADEKGAEEPRMGGASVDGGARGEPGTPRGQHTPPECAVSLDECAGQHKPVRGEQQTPRPRSEDGREAPSFGKLEGEEHAPRGAVDLSPGQKTSTRPDGSLGQHLGGPAVDDAGRRPLVESKSPSSGDVPSTGLFGLPTGSTPPTAAHKDHIFNGARWSPSPVIAAEANPNELFVFGRASPVDGSDQIDKKTDVRDRVDTAGNDLSVQHEMASTRPDSGHLGGPAVDAWSLPPEAEGFGGTVSQTLEGASEAQRLKGIFSDFPDRPALRKSALWRPRKSSAALPFAPSGGSAPTVAETTEKTGNIFGSSAPVFSVSTAKTDKLFVFGQDESRVDAERKSLAEELSKMSADAVPGFVKNLIAEKPTVLENTLPTLLENVLPAETAWDILLNLETRHSKEILSRYQNDAKIRGVFRHFLSSKKPAQEPIIRRANDKAIPRHLAAFDAKRQAKIVEGMDVKDCHEILRQVQLFARSDHPKEPDAVVSAAKIVSHFQPDSLRDFLASPYCPFGSAVNVLDMLPCLKNRAELLQSMERERRIDLLLRMKKEARAEIVQHLKNTKGTAWIVSEVFPPSAKPSRVRDILSAFPIHQWGELIRDMGDEQRNDVLLCVSMDIADAATVVSQFDDAPLRSYLNALVNRKDYTAGAGGKILMQLGGARRGKVLQELGICVAAERLRAEIDQDFPDEKLAEGEENIAEQLSKMSTNNILKILNVMTEARAVKYGPTLLENMVSAEAAWHIHLELAEKRSREILRHYQNDDKIRDLFRFFLSWKEDKKKRQAHDKGIPRHLTVFEEKRRADIIEGMGIPDQHEILRQMQDFDGGAAKVVPHFEAENLKRFLASQEFPAGSAASVLRMLSSVERRAQLLRSMEEMVAASSIQQQRLTDLLGEMTHDESAEMFKHLSDAAVRAALVAFPADSAKNNLLLVDMARRARLLSGIFRTNAKHALAILGQMSATQVAEILLADESDHFSNNFEDAMVRDILASLVYAEKYKNGFAAKILKMFSLDRQKHLLRGMTVSSSDRMVGAAERIRAELATYTTSAPNNRPDASMDVVLGGTMDPAVLDAMDPAKAVAVLSCAVGPSRLLKKFSLHANILQDVSPVVGGAPILLETDEPKKCAELLQQMPRQKANPLLQQMPAEYARDVLRKFDSEEARGGALEAMMGGAPHSEKAMINILLKLHPAEVGRALLHFQNDKSIRTALAAVPPADAVFILKEFILERQAALLEGMDHYPVEEGHPSVNAPALRILFKMGGAEVGNILMHYTEDAKVITVLGLLDTARALQTLGEFEDPKRRARLLEGLRSEVRIISSWELIFKANSLFVCSLYVLLSRWKRKVGL